MFSSSSSVLSKTVHDTNEYYANNRIVNQIKQRRQLLKKYNYTVPKWKSLPPFSKTITKLAFGSCSFQWFLSLPYWDTLASYYQPDLFLMMGDNVYASCKSSTCPELQKAYRRLASHRSCKGAAPSLSVLATLDDHDYGKNDIDMTYPYKDIAQEYFKEFFNIPSPASLPLANDLIDNSGTKDGVFRSGIWGSSNATNNEMVQVILLDTRYMRSPFINKNKDAANPTYIPYNSTQEVNVQILSERQWGWLEENFQLPAKIRIIVSSIQVLTDVSPFEAWRYIPKERKRLYDLIYDTTIGDSSVTILLSGDRHNGGIYQQAYSKSPKQTNPVITLYEITSSSLTHTYPRCISDKDCDDPRRIGDFVFKDNFGTIDIDWNNQILDMSLRESSDSDSILQSKKISF